MPYAAAERALLALTWDKLRPQTAPHPGRYKLAGANLLGIDLSARTCMRGPRRANLEGCEPAPRGG